MLFLYGLGRLFLDLGLFFLFLFRDSFLLHTSPPFGILAGSCCLFRFGFLSGLCLGILTTSFFDLENFPLFHLFIDHRRIQTSLRQMPSIYDSLTLEQVFYCIRGYSTLVQPVIHPFFLDAQLNGMRDGIIGSDALDILPIPRSA